jgi:hypothetical protein
MEKAMPIKSLTVYAIGAVSGVAMLGLSLSPASAFTLAAPSLEKPVASAQIDKVWWRGGWGGGWRGGWRRGPGWGYRGWGYRGYGWGPAAVVWGLAAGAVVGSALAAPGYYGPGPAYGPGPGYYGNPSYQGRDCRAGFDGVVHCRN